MQSEEMDEALRLAEKAASLGEVRVGAVVVGPDQTIIGRGYNRVLMDHDPSAHAEIMAIREACKSLGSERLIDCDLYVTLEPCPMCAQAISFARIRRLYFAADDTKGGGVENGARVYQQTSCHHKPDVYSGLSATKAADMLRSFFKERR